MLPDFTFSGTSIFSGTASEEDTAPKPTDLLRNSIGDLPSPAEELMAKKRKSYSDGIAKAKSF